MTSAIRYLDLGTGRPIALTPRDAVLASSAALGWPRSAIAERQLLPPQARAEHGILGHRAFVNLGPPVDFSWGTGRNRRRGALPTGGLHAQPHGAVNAPAWAAPLRTVSFAFDPAWLEEQAGGPPGRGAQLVREHRNEADAALHAVALALDAELSDPWPDPLRGGALLLAAAARLLEAHGPGSAARRGEALSPARARAALELIEAGLGGRLTVADLAAAAGLSEARFARGFAARFGVPPHRYVLGRRVALARGLLARGEPPAAVAARCGFHDQAHLTRAFRAATGATPAAWAREARRKTTTGHTGGGGEALLAVQARHPRPMSA